MNKFAKIKVRCLIAIAMLSASIGCHTRYYAVSDALDKGEHIRTRYKYWIVDSSGEQWPHTSLMPDVFSPNGIPVEVSSSNGNHLSDFNLWSCHGSIANLDTGSPMSPAESEVLQAIVGVTGIWLVPLGIMALYSLDIDGQEGMRNYSINIPGTGSHSASYLKVYERQDKMTGLCLCIPVPYFCYYGNPAPEAFAKGRGFTNHVFSDSGFERAPSSADRAFIYGLAARLKDLEDSGTINETVVRNAQNIRNAIIEKSRRKVAEENTRKLAQMHRQQEEARKRQEQERLRLAAQETRRREDSLAAQQRQQTQAAQSPQIVQIVRQAVQEEPQKPKFSISTFEPAGTGDNFSYSFEVALNGESTPDELFNMWGSVLAGLKRIYLIQNPAMDEKSLVVEAKPSLRNGKFAGIARMLTIHIEAMEYDPTTRRGKISARFGPGQERFARDWIKLNIMEPLVKDKNILLTTGETPPSGKYYSLGEMVKDGNILEMEFKVE